MIVYLNVVLLVDIVTCTPEHNSVATEPVPQSSASEPPMHASDQVFTHIYSPLQVFTSFALLGSLLVFVYWTYLNTKV